MSYGWKLRVTAGIYLLTEGIMHISHFVDVFIYLGI